VASDDNAALRVERRKLDAAGCGSADSLFPLFGKRLGNWS